MRIDPARQNALPPITLSVASSTQTVDVSANETIVDIASAEIATTVSQAQITNLPVLGRQIVNLFNTQAGVTQINRTATVINGMRPSYSNVTFDGINVQDTVRTNDLDLLNNRFTIAQVAEFNGHIFQMFPPREGQALFIESPGAAVIACIMRKGAQAVQDGGQVAGLGQRPCQAERRCQRLARTGQIP